MSSLVALIGSILYHVGWALTVMEILSLSSYLGHSLISFIYKSLQDIYSCFYRSFPENIPLSLTNASNYYVIQFKLLHFRTYSGLIKDHQIIDLRLSKV